MMTIHPQETAPVEIQHRHQYRPVDRDSLNLPAAVGKYAFTLMLCLCVIVGEVHNFFPNTGAYNWIITRTDTAMTLQWNVWHIGKELVWLILILAVPLYRRNKVNIIALRVFTYFAVLDILLYFYNFKTWEYGKSYIWMVAAGLLWYNWRRITSYLWHILNRWR